MRKAIVLAVVFVVAPTAHAGEARVISTDELARLTSGPPERWGLTLVDARTGVEFSESHIPGAVLVPADAIASRLAKTVKDRERLVVFYCNGPNCTKTVKAAKAAAALGYRNVAEYKEGLPGWGKSGRPTAGRPLARFEAPLVTPAELGRSLAASAPPFVMDIRDAEEFAVFRIPGATSVPLDDVEARVGSVPPGRAIVIVDHAGHQAPVAGRLLHQLGRKDVARLDGGILRWQADGLRVVR